MLQRIFTYIAYAFSVAVMFYLLFVIWWLFLPIFVVLLAFIAWRMYQTRKIWNTLLKQAKNRSPLVKA